MPVRYVPILKGKEGEYSALAELKADVREVTLPLIEVPEIPRDWERDRPAKSMEDHVSGVAGKIKNAWGSAPVFLDFPWFASENLANGTPAMASVLEQCRLADVRPIPVLYRTSSPGHIRAAKTHQSATKAGVCLRLLTEDFSDEIEVEDELDALLDRASVSPSETDLIVDLDNLTADPEMAALVVRSIKATLPHIGSWRRIVLAASSFPQDLSEISAATVSQIPRVEWQLWERVRRKPERALREDVIFGDYAIAHPEPKELDPRMMRMSASIRYTTPKDWLVLKGRNVRQWGYEQFYELCEVLVKRPEYAGEDYSAGDAYIAACARRETGPGNATTWRKVATNHHMTMVAKQLASSSAP